MKSTFAERSYSFALRIAQTCQSVMEERREYIFSKQLARSGSAVGALYREAQHAESRADFIHKLAIAQKECNESLYWIDLLFDSNYLSEKSHRYLKSEATELMYMLTAMIKTAKANKDKRLSEKG
jgi:four helix bundle protein